MAYDQYFDVGDKLKDQFVAKKKLGEGSFGSVYLVQSLKKKNIWAAMKVEPVQKSKDDEILKMEVFVMKKLQNSKHVCKLLMSGRTRKFNYLIMSILGKDLGEIRRRMPDRKLTLSTVLRVGIQSCEALQDLHEAGFIHRDIKPSNFSYANSKKDNIYIFDFGIARQILLPDKTGHPKLREPRTKVSFRGTVRYCSVNVHLYKEQGRHDDMISMIFMCIELLMRNLPWKGMARKDSGHLKESISDKQLFQGCPPSFNAIYGICMKLTYFDKPPYEQFRDLFKKDMKTFKCKMDDPYDWLKNLPEPIKEKNKKPDQHRTIDKENDLDTLKGIDDSMETLASEGRTETKGFAKEDTLDDIKI